MRKVLVLFGLLALTGCDEPTVITHVDRLHHMTQDQLVVMQDARGIPVEFHGRPFLNDVPHAELAAAMRPPNGSAQGVRFHAVAPGHSANGHGWRLVLHFNPQDDVPNSFEDCKLSSEANTAGPMTEAFSVNATFCKGTEWQAHGFMRVLKIAKADPDAFARAMKQLFLAILPKNSDPDR
ncbi:MAG: hypothetical protein AAGH68_07910 [Pseudomonadota bacterium]